MKFSFEYQNLNLAYKDPKQVKEILNYIDNKSILSLILKKAQHQLKLRKILQNSIERIGLKNLTDYIHSSEYCILTNQWMLLITKSAVLNRLRQKTPTLLTSLQDSLPNLKQIKIKTAPQLLLHFKNEKEEKSLILLSMSDTGYFAWEVLYQKIKDHPKNANLRNKIEQLLLNKKDIKNEIFLVNKI